MDGNQLLEGNVTELLSLENFSLIIKNQFLTDTKMRKKKSIFLKH
jgi:hypothetical protein